MRLDLATRTLFSDFQENAFARLAVAKEIQDHKTFVRKRVKGHVYWYLQHYKDGQYKQQYYGPSNKRNDAHVKEYRTQWRKKKAQYKQLLEKEMNQAAMLRRGGLPSMDKRITSVLLCLSETGSINENGVLIGTLAYIAYSGMLGALFEKMTLKTNDIDIVHEGSVSVAIDKEVDLPKLLEKSGLNFRAVPGLKANELPSSFISPDGIRIDLLIPQKGRPKGVVPIVGFKDTGARQLPLLDFLIQSSVRTVLLGTKGAIVVRVPEPARFCVHKLMIASRRPVTEAAKRLKDLHQASQLIEVLAEEQPIELKSAWKLACSHGKKWMKLLKDAVKELPQKTQNILQSTIK